MDVQPTATVIKNISRLVTQYANEIDIIADKMLVENDISYTAEAISSIRNLIGNIRLDLLITTPFRAYEREIDNLKQ